MLQLQLQNVLPIIHTPPHGTVARAAIPPSILPTFSFSPNKFGDSIVSSVFYSNSQSNYTLEKGKSIISRASMASIQSNSSTRSSLYDESSSTPSSNISSKKLNKSLFHDLKMMQKSIECFLNLWYVLLFERKIFCKRFKLKFLFFFPQQLYYLKDT